jgi:mannose-1-phosphate guanylyltransferase/mannose-6-phosphate isomerase
VLLSGGVGSRLWPLSRAAVPKQLQAVLGHQTMVQATAGRARGLPGLGAPLVVCNKMHVGAIVSQLDAIDCPPRLVVAEPGPRNTAAAVAAAAIAADPDSVLVVLPADHVIADDEAFRSAVETAVDRAVEGELVVFGVVPDRAESGYGYIEVGDPVGGGANRVRSFVEKPDAETAADLVESGHLWNSGMFVFRPETVLEEMRRHAPDVLDAVQTGMDEAVPGDSVLEPSAAFLGAPSVAFDRAVMERTDRASVVPLDAGWSDVGSWATLWEIEERDADGNVVRGDAIVHDVHGSYVRSDGRLVAVVGLDDVVVVDSGDAVLVAARDRVQEVKVLVERLRRDERPEVDR